MRGWLIAFLLETVVSAVWSKVEDQLASGRQNPVLLEETSERVIESVRV